MAEAFASPQMTIQSSQAFPMEVAPHVQPREKPGWMAIALIAAFVLAAVALYLAGARLVSRATGDLSSVAVLPFNDVGPEPFGTPFAQELSDELARVEGLRVFTPPGIAGKRIGAVVEGTVLRSGSRMRVSSRLVQVANRRLLWSHTYESAVEDVSAVRGDMVRAIVNALHQSGVQVAHP
jgi:TolB-like protein